MRDALGHLRVRGAGRLASQASLLDDQDAEVGGGHRVRVEVGPLGRRGVTGAADAAEGAVPVQRRAGVGDGHEHLGGEAAVARPPLVGDLDPAHVAQLERQEVDRRLVADLAGELGDVHVPATLLVGAHGAAVGVAVDHQGVVLGREALLAEGDELPDVARVGRVDLVLLVLRHAGEELVGVQQLGRLAPEAIDARAGEVGSQAGAVGGEVLAAVDEQDHLHAGVVVDRGAHVVHELEDRTVGVVVGGAVDHQGPRALRGLLLRAGFGRHDQPGQGGENQGSDRHRSVSSEMSCRSSASPRCQCSRRSATARSRSSFTKAAWMAACSSSDCCMPAVPRR